MTTERPRRCSKWWTLQAGAIAPVTTYIQQGTDHPELVLRFLNQNGRRVAEVSSDPLKLDPMRPEETLLLVLGNTGSS